MSRRLAWRLHPPKGASQHHCRRLSHSRIHWRCPVTQAFCYAKHLAMQGLKPKESGVVNSQFIGADSSHCRPRNPTAVPLRTVLSPSETHGVTHNTPCKSSNAVAIAGEGILPKHTTFASVGYGSAQFSLISFCSTTLRNLSALFENPSVSSDNLVQLACDRGLDEHWRR